MIFSLPPGMEFIRLDATSFVALEQQWTDECATFGEDFAVFASPSIEHAKKIALEAPPDPKYGIFSVLRDNRFEIITHMNRAALPGTSGGHTLRVLWALAAPRYDFDQINPDELGPVVAGLFTGVLQTATHLMSSRYVKVHIGSTPDKAIFSGMARALESVRAVSDVTTRGNWLHLTLTDG